MPSFRQATMSAPLGGRGGCEGGKTKSHMYPNKVLSLRLNLSVCLSVIGYKQKTFFLNKGLMSNNI